jgi:hypothetical protein
MTVQSDVGLAGVKTCWPFLFAVRAGELCPALYLKSKFKKSGAKP